MGTAIFDLGAIKDINLTDQPVTPGFFKFGGIELYGVVEQKCGATTYFNRGNASQAKGDYESAIADYNEALRIDPKFVSATIQRVIALGRLGKPRESNATAQAPITLEQGDAAPKKELEQDKSVSIPAQTPPQANMNEIVPTSENKIVQNQSENASCGDKKSIYVADSLADAEGGRAIIEVSFKNKLNEAEKSDHNSEFEIREYRNNNLEWLYKGKYIQGRFVFTPIHSRSRKNLGGFIFTSVPVSRQKPVMLSPSYVKPNRDGTGEAILYLSGLRAIFASREGAHRFKFEGKRPTELLPEAFYFDRCE